MPTDRVERLARLHPVHGVLAATYHAGLLRTSAGEGHREQRKKERFTDHSHSMVAGGLLLMSYTTRFTPFT